ncbi:MAG: flavin reductase family protein [Candidatus Bathyarchaeota archaeon]|nr:flavin reductase family protein [Candidatus Bathyarchaeota archaeon]
MKKTLSNTKLFQAGPLSVVVMATAINAEGQANIITLGMYMPISFSPPLVCIGIAPQRYSHDLISRSGEFVVNIPSIDLVEEMHFCGTKSGRNIDKFTATSLTAIPAKVVKTPLIKECIGHLECKVIQTHVCGDHTLFVGQVVSACADETILSNGNFDPLKARPIVQKNHVYFTVTDN